MSHLIDKAEKKDAPKTLRKVRSFVRRVGRITAGQSKALTTVGPEYLLSIDSCTCLNFTELYGNPHPIVLEIGFGMGHSLLAQAIAHPDYNYLGFEVHEPGVGALLAGIERASLKNIRVAAQDVVAELACIPDRSLQGVQIFFPDPWPKKRHHKRRLIQASFVKQLAEKLVTGGFLHCATDCQDYAEAMLRAIDASQCFSKATYIARPETRPITKFEQRALKLGHEIWDVSVVNL